MADVIATSEALELLLPVRRLIADRLEKLTSLLGSSANIELLMPGKMLRTRLAARLAAADLSPVNPSTLQRACAATEMVHTASLCHDDVIDNSYLRRAKPTLWMATTPSAAVLIGDMLLCDALSLLFDTEAGRYSGAFIAKVKEVCSAEADQELLFRGKQLDEATCLRLARGKTGPLFAFVAYVCGGDDEGLSVALEEAGYRIGTAYQFADDLIDVIGDDDVAGKTLGTDAKRRKFTLPQASAEGRRSAQAHIRGLCTSAVDRLNEWPSAGKALEQFLLHDLRSVFDRYDLQL